MVCGGSAVLNTGISLYVYQHIGLVVHLVSCRFYLINIHEIIWIYFVAGSSLKNEAYSAYMSGPKTYNAIDSDFIAGEYYI